MRRKLLLILNPNAGMQKANKYLVNILNIFTNMGYDAKVCITQKNYNATEIVRNYGNDSELIVCIGGDGTLNQTVSGMVSINYKGLFGYIPSGSVNDFATTLNLSKDVMYAVGDILMGKTVEIDVGKLNDSYFSYVASCGIFTRAAYDTSQDIKNIFGRLAYIFEGVKDLADLKTHHMRFETNDGVYEDDYIFVAISNSTSVGGMLKLDQSIVDLSDGLLELLLIKKPTTLTGLKDVIKALQTKDYSCDLVEFHSISSARVVCETPTTWTLDGERMEGNEIIQIKNLKRAVNIIVP